MDPTTTPTPTPNPAPAPAPEPAATPVPPVAPAAPVPPVAPATPVTPVPPVAGQMSMAEAFQQAPAVPGQAPGFGGNGLGATDPITMPAPPKAPDPVEEELNAPFKPTAPVPGSIGSAISMPAGEGGEVPMGEPGHTPSVSFTDPALTNGSSNPSSAPVPGKKDDKKKLIMLAAVAGVIVIVLAVVLVMQLLPQGNS